MMVPSTAATGKVTAAQPGQTNDQEIRDHDSDGSVAAEFPEQVVHKPSPHEQAHAQADRGAFADWRVLKVDQESAVVIHHAKQQQARDPRDRGLPLEPMQFLRQQRRSLLLLHKVESAAMHHPDELLRVLVRVAALFQFDESPVEPREVIRRAHPHDAGKHVRPAQGYLEPFLPVKLHRSFESG
jgi:hypothetical protein